MREVCANNSNRVVATFWEGKSLPALDQACLLTFKSHGFDVVVYSFNKIENLSAELNSKDAGEIVEESSLRSFIYGGRPNLSHFSDYFRYNLFNKTNYTWIDTDMACLTEFSVDPSSNLFAKEAPNSICGAIMHVRKEEPLLGDLIRKTEKLMNKELHWGETGPRLLTKVLGKTAIEFSSDPSEFFPIHYDDFYKVFVAEDRDECVERCKRAKTLHLWNNLVVSMGVWKEIGPPENSFLYEIFNKAHVLDVFKDFYPRSVMNNMTSNWVLRQTGGALGIKMLARQLGPGIYRSFSPRINRLIRGKVH
ncbi:hypothetical protein ACLBXB_28145 [Methylobacterium mesophilicum]